MKNNYFFIVKYACPICNGKGKIKNTAYRSNSKIFNQKEVKCIRCNGKGNTYDFIQSYSEILKINKMLLDV